MASSLVGVRISDFIVFQVCDNSFSLERICKVGIAKAAVFPVPV